MKGASRRAVLSGRHQSEAERFEALRLHRDAEQAAGFARHEVHVLGRAALGRHDEVALVLWILVVHDDDHLPRADGAEGLLHGLDPFGAVRRRLPSGRARALRGPLGHGPADLIGRRLRGARRSEERSR